MIDHLLALIAPHHCSGCTKIGTLLCDNCKYDITSEPFGACVACGKNLAGPSGICTACKVPYERAWCVGERQEALRRLIDAYKFYNAKAASRTLADLLDATLPELPASTVIVPVPTVSSHIRERGYDHMALIAKALARRRGLAVDFSLTRKTRTKQRDAGRRQRIKQAKEAFECRQSLAGHKTYLLIDDVVTTGSTVKYAAKTLRDAGAEHIWVVAISRQTLD
jgi:ComF family protein